MKKNVFAYFFSIHSSSRHEKRCRMLQRIFWLFQWSRNQRWQHYGSVVFLNFALYFQNWRKKLVKSQRFVQAFHHWKILIKFVKWQHYIRFCFSISLVISKFFRKNSSEHNGFKEVFHRRSLLPETINEKNWWKLLNFKALLQVYILTF